MIDELREHYPTQVLCVVFAVRASSYYHHRWRSNRIDIRRLDLRIRVKQIFDASRGSAGSRTISHILKNEGVFVGRYLARNLMEEQGLVSKQPGRKHRYKQGGKSNDYVPNHLNREFKVSGPNQVWCGDITYLFAKNRWIYLATVMDLYARKSVGYAVSETADSQLVISALNDAVMRRGRHQDLLFHSDQGVQYSSLGFKQHLRNYQIRQSMSRKGNCWDNAPMERLFRSLKTEWVPQKGYTTVAEAKVDVGLYLMDYYNRYRPHTANNGLSPYFMENNLSRCPK